MIDEYGAYEALSADPPFTPAEYDERTARLEAFSAVLEAEIDEDGELERGEFSVQAIEAAEREFRARLEGGGQP
jgi:hypothetical protein